MQRLLKNNRRKTKNSINNSKGKIMLTQEVIKSNKVLEGLSEEQLNAIVTLSQNDENSVIGAKFSEVYQKLDAIIAKETGIARNGDEKTYNYLERAARELKSQLKSVEPLNAKIAELQSEKTKLEEAIKSGQGNEELKKQLEQANADNASIKKQFNDLKKDFEKSNEKHAKELLDVNISNELAKATSGIQFKKDLPTGVTSVILEQTVAKVKAMNPEFIENGQGGKILAFKDNTGAIMRIDKQGTQSNGSFGRGTQGGWCRFATSTTTSRRWRCLHD